MHTNIMHDVVYFNLQLFADGAEGAGGASAAEGIPAAGGTAVESAVAEQTGDVSTPDLDAEFADLVKGKYKDAYDKMKSRDTEPIIKDRLKGVHKELKATQDKYKALSEALADLYGMDDATDVKALLAEIDKAERPGLEKRAFENGVDEDTQRQIDILERKAKRADRLDKEAAAEAERAAFWATKFNEAETLKQQFPGFDLDAEMRGTTDANRLFQSLIYNGASVESAFKAAHFDELTRGAMAYTAQQVEQGVINKVKANGARPSENGSSTSAARQKVDINKMSLDDLDALAERARRGERITF